MKIRQAVSVTVATSLLLMFSTVHGENTQAQTRTCSMGNYGKPASSTYRTVELPEFGIEVDIPENYRTMKLQSGAVEILHPDDYDFIQCMASGGRGRGGGYHSQIIRLVSREEAVQRLQNDISGGSAEVREHRQGDFSGYITTSRSGYGLTFMGTTPGISKAFVIAESCDCDVEVGELTNLISRIRLSDETKQLSGLQESMPYSEARQLLIDAGWKPFVHQIPLNGREQRVFEEYGYPEVMACAGTGRAPCIFMFQSEDGKELTVYTVGGELRVNGWKVE